MVHGTSASRAAGAAFHGLPHGIGELIKRPERLLAAGNDTDLLPAPIQTAHLIQTAHVIQGLRAHDASVRVSPQVAGPCWLAVGDAALAFDPLSSQGIFFALYSGVRSDEAVVAARRVTPLALSDYGDRVGRVYGADDQARRHFFACESRYPDQRYWRTQGQLLAPIGGADGVG